MPLMAKPTTLRNNFFRNTRWGRYRPADCSVHNCTDYDSVRSPGTAPPGRPAWNRPRFGSYIRPFMWIIPTASTISWPVKPRVVRNCQSSSWPWPSGPPRSQRCAAAPGVILRSWSTPPSASVMTATLPGGLQEVLRGRALHLGTDTVLDRGLVFLRNERRPPAI